MPHIHDSTPRDEITIAGHVHTVPHPYHEGYVLTANEAKALNQTFGENLRNNLASKLKELLEAGNYEPASFQATVDEYAKTYEFGHRSSGGARGPRLDPVAKEALDLAKAKLTEALRKKGKSPSDISAADFTSLAKQILEKHPALMELARERVAAVKSVADIEIEGLSETYPSEESPKPQRKAKAA
jgi:hypothetical protein